MNPQVEAFGRDVIGFSPANPDGEKICVLIYFDKGDDIPISFIRSEQNLTDWQITFNGQLFKCQKSRLGNSPLFKTIIVPIDDQHPVIDFSANNSWG